MPPWMPLNRRVLRTLSDHGNSATVLMLSPSTPNGKIRAGDGRSPRARPSLSTREVKSAKMVGLAPLFSATKTLPSGEN
jgi:hypothetical protein